MATRRTKHDMVIGFLALCAIGLVFHWPLVSHLATHVVGRPFDDCFQVLWHLDWMQCAILDEGVNPFYAPDVYYPHGWYIASGAEPAWYLAALVPVARAIGTVRTYNLVLLSSFILGAFAAYLLAYEYCKGIVPCLVAGVAYVTAPVLTLRMGGHLNLMMGMPWIPITLLLLRRTAKTRMRGIRYATAAALSMALAILACWYYLFIVIIAAYAFFLTVPSPVHWRKRLLRGGLALAVCLALISPFAWLTFQARQEMLPSGASFSLAESDGYSLSLDRLFVLNPQQVIWGNVSRSKHPIHGEQDIVALSYAALALAAVCLSARRGEMRPLASMAGVALVLAMGTTLHWDGSQVIVSLGKTGSKAVAIISSWLGNPAPVTGASTPIPLPGFLLARFVPFYSSMRVWARFTIILELAIATWAAMGAAWLIEQRSWLVGLPVVAILLIMLEGWITPYPSFTEVAANDRPKTNAWIARQVPETSLIEYPRHPRLETVSMYSQSLHHHPVANGYMAFQPDYLKMAEPQLGIWPSESTLPLLRKWGIDLIVVSTNETWQTRQALADVTALRGLEHLVSFDEGFIEYDQTHIFRILDSSVPHATSAYALLDGFGGLELGANSRQVHWSNGDGLLAFAWPEADTQTPADFTLVLSLAGGRPPGVPTCRVSIEAEGVELMTRELPDGPLPYILTVVAQDLVNTEDVDLEVWIRSNTWVPDRYNGLGDTRELGIMLYEAQLRSPADAP